MNIGNKLQEMLDQGWQIKISRTMDGTWDVVGALEGWRTDNDEHTYATYGVHSLLLSALVDMERMLLDADIQDCINQQQRGTDRDQRYYSSRLQSMQSIKNRLNADQEM